MVNFLKRQRSRIQSFGCKTSIFTGFFCRHTANRSVAWRHKEWQAGWEVAWPGESRESLGALTICMENTVIPRRIQMERFIPVENFRKKSNSFQALPSFFPFWPKRPKFFVPLWLTSSSAKLPVEAEGEKWRSFPRRVTRSSFRKHFQVQYHLSEIFYRNFLTNGKRSWIPLVFPA